MCPTRREGSSFGAVPRDRPRPHHHDVVGDSRVFLLEGTSSPFRPSLPRPRQTRPEPSDLHECCCAVSDTRSTSTPVPGGGSSGRRCQVPRRLVHPSVVPCCPSPTPLSLPRLVRAACPGQTRRPLLPRVRPLCLCRDWSGARVRGRHDVHRRRRPLFPPARTQASAETHLRGSPGEGGPAPAPEGPVSPPVCRVTEVRVRHVKRDCLPGCTKGSRSTGKPDTSFVVFKTFVCWEPRPPDSQRPPDQGRQNYVLRPKQHHRLPPPSHPPEL